MRSVIFRVLAGLIAGLCLYVIYHDNHSPEDPTPIYYYSIPCIFGAYAILGDKMVGKWMDLS